MKCWDKKTIMVSQKFWFTTCTVGQVVAEGERLRRRLSERIERIELDTVPELYLF